MLFCRQPSFGDERVWERSEASRVSVKDIEWDESSCAFWNNTVKYVSASRGRYKYMKNVLWPHSVRFRSYLSCTLASAEYGRKETKCFVSKKKPRITAGNSGVE